MATHLFHSYLDWKGDTRNRIWSWLHFVPCFWFQILFSVIPCVFDLILWNCFASFCLKKIEKKNYSKTSDQQFVFSFHWIIVTSRTCWEQVLWIEWTHTKNFRRCNTNFWCNQAKLFYLSTQTHISTKNGKKMSTLRVPLCLRLHIKSRLRLSRWAK